MPSYNAAFNVTGDERILTLTIVVGHAQEGSTTFRVSGGGVVETRQGSFSSPIGRGKDLAGRTLYCSTVVADIRPETNATSVTYEVSDGTNAIGETREEVVPKPGGIAIYSAAIDFLR